MDWNTELKAKAELADTVVSIENEMGEMEPRNHQYMMILKRFRGEEKDGFQRWGQIDWWKMLGWLEGNGVYMSNLYIPKQSVAS